jgi:uncharacterized glyoxalase superfamily metalloenzyme YdcJ
MPYVYLGTKVLGRWAQRPITTIKGRRRVLVCARVRYEFMTTMSTNAVRPQRDVHADKIEMQHKLFAELSRMFAAEVPLYDKALLVNRITNRAVCDVLAARHPGFAISDDQLDRTSGERHGAIRIGKSIEYRWIGRFFAAFAMEPHNFYDMTNVGSKSQPIIATAFRSSLNPEHRVFTSLLQTDYFDAEMGARIDALLASREVFSARAKALIEKGEREGGLNWADANALIEEATGTIFKWTGTARDLPLYKQLCDAGFKIAADIACFDSHHLNHLTPNTFCIDLYTAAMKHAMGEMDSAAFAARATLALSRIAQRSDRHSLRLQFRHFSTQEIAAFATVPVQESIVAGVVRGLVERFSQPDVALKLLKHAGYKDFTEGPCESVPILLRQDAYKALTEPVVFRNDDGTTVAAVHTARFGEIEQRGYATTESGRELYDRCLAVADAAREKDPSLPKKDFAAYEKLYADPFAPFGTTLTELVARQQVYVRFVPTQAGKAAKGTIGDLNIAELINGGYVTIEGLRYEDFLPVSAAGIFASNLNQYGTQSTAKTKPKYTQAQLEQVLGRPIICSDAVYRALQARSVLDLAAELGLNLRPADVESFERDSAILRDLAGER